MPTPYRERFRPQFHFSPPSAWMNDPNGLVYYKGEYHLFYQHYPNDIVWGPMHWGHAVSRDLVHWTPLPIALYPDAIGTIFSGTIVVDEENSSGLVPDGGLVAIFSYDVQSQGAAFSTDNGRTWQMYAGNPIMPALRKDFRDPKIFWHTETNRWVMVIAAGTTLMFFTSANLLEWEFASEFVGQYFGGVWEVPDLFPLTVGDVTKWLLLLSVNPTAPAGGSGTRYFIGDFDGKTFSDDYPDETLWFDYGADNYAGTTWNSAPDQQRVFIGWMNNWLYGDKTPTEAWRGAATLPRDISLQQTSAGVRAVQTPIDALKMLRQPITTPPAQTLNGKMTLEGVRGHQLEIVVEFLLHTASKVGVEISDTQISYDVAAGQLSIERAQANIPNFTTHFDAPLTLENGRLRLHIFVDQASVEVFASDGLLAMTAQMFPESHGDSDNGVSLFADGEAQIVSLEVYALKSIWG